MTTVMDTTVRTDSRSQSEQRLRIRRFQANRLAMLGVIFSALLICAGLLAPLIAPYGPATIDFQHTMAPAFSHGHLLGTDILGRDILSRMLFSLRTALIISFGAQFFALTVALFMGTIAGYVGGRPDQLLMAVTDVMFAFPTYLFTVILVTVMGRGELSIIIAIAIGSWAGLARLIRAQVIKLKALEFVEAGRAMGAKHPTLLLRYILPNALGPILVAVSFGIPAAMLAEAGLAILGLGVEPPTPSWGSMIVDGYTYVLTDPALVAGPLVLFALTMLAFTWIGDGFRDAFDTYSN